MPFKFNPLSSQFDLDDNSGGTVVGPGSSTNDALVRWDGTTGTDIQDSVAILTDAGALSGVTQLDVDNIRVDGNTISSTNANGNILLSPNGSGITNAATNLYVGSATPSNPFDLALEKSVSGLVGVSIQNTSNNAAAGSVVEIISEPAAADAYTEYVVNGATTWSVGIDNSDSDRFKVTTGASPSAGTQAISITTAGLVSLSSPLPLASGGTASSLVDPNADRILFWDDSASAVDWLTAGSGLSISGTTITATSTADVVGPASSTDNAITRFDGTTGKLLQNSVPTIDDTGNLSISASVSGASLSATVANTSNTASATAFYNAQVAGSTASDAYYKAEISGGQAWTVGLDNSDSDAFVISASATPGTTNAFRANTSGGVNTPLQPSFEAYVNATISNVTGNGTQYVIASNWTEVTDVRGGFDTSTGVFTVPAGEGGDYCFTAAVMMIGLTGVTSLNYQFLRGDGTAWYFNNCLPAPSASGARYTASGSIILTLAAGDTMGIRVQGQGAAGDTADIEGSASPRFTYFMGRKLG